MISLRLPVLRRDGVLLQRLHLLEEGENVHHAPVTDDASRLGLNDTDGDEMEGDGLAIDNDGVSGVGASGGTTAEVVSTRWKSCDSQRTYLQSYPPTFPFPRHPTGNP